MRNPFKKLSKKVSIFAEFSEHLDEATGSDCDCYYVDALEEIFKASKKWSSCKALLKDFKRNLGIKGSHRRTPWWEKVLFVTYTICAYLLGMVGVIAALLFMFVTFKIEFIIWLRERAKINRRKKAVQYIMDKKKQGYDSPSWRDEGA
ncbi:MAG: hypothetical protein KAS36_00335 [Anaerolineales bacterium]|nr:hypothetical protein [Anaerolineales bacterium]